MVGLAVLSACLGGGIVGIVVGQPNQAQPAPETVPAPVQRTPQVTQTSPQGNPVPVPRTDPAPRLPSNPTVRPAAPVAGTVIEVSPAPTPMEVVPAKGEAAPEGETTQNNDNPTGRQEPAVSLQWIGPPTAKLGQTVTYQIMAKNVCSSPVEHVVVRYRVPPGITVHAAEPYGTAEGNTLSWDLGTLQPSQDKRIDLQLVPDTRGGIACQAQVTFTGASTIQMQVREPKLQLRVVAPAKVILGETATVTVTLTNPGDDAAEHVKLKAMLSEGLEHASGKKIVDFELGNLAPKENRDVQLVCTTKVGGMQRVTAAATADGNLNAQDMGVFEVVQPVLDLVATGPKLRYLDRHATYVFKVTNPGNAPASNVAVTDQIPLGFKFHAASAGGRHDFSSRTVSWLVGDLTPGQSREVSLDVVAINPGEFKHQVAATGAMGLKVEGEVFTRVEGLSALLMELADVDDPVEVGADTAYEIRVTNTGSKTETNLELICFIPDKMEFRGAKCPAGCHFHVQGRDVVFEPLPKLAPRADAIYRVNVRGLAPGDVRFRARIKADGLTDPVLREESTKVYGDDVR
jgi:uncharacterized repeat protein (TIGR01451 family)